jgi:hypothetical protein
VFTTSEPGMTLSMTSGIAKTKGSEFIHHYIKSGNKYHKTKEDNYYY